MSARNTTVGLCSAVPLNQGAAHTLTFDNRTAQTNYFSIKTTQQFQNLSYQRISKGSVKLSGDYNAIYKCNYMWINNGETFGTSTKKNQNYYCFIDNIEYISDNAFIVYYTVDLIQTFWFEFAFDYSCYVEREHTNDDSKFANTVHEPFNLGEFTQRISTSRTSPSGFNITLDYYISMSNSDSSKTHTAVPEGLTEVTIQPRFFIGTLYKGSYSAVKKYTQELINAGTDSFIMGIWTAPSLTSAAGNYSFSIERPYNPTNKKLYNGQFGMFCCLTPVSSDYIAPECVKGDSVYCYVQAPNTAQGMLSYQFSFYNNTYTKGADLQFNKVYQASTTGAWSSNQLAQYLAQNTARIAFTQATAQQEFELNAKGIENRAVNNLASSAMNFVSGAALLAVPGTQAAGAAMMGSGLSSAVMGANQYKLENERNEFQLNTVINGEAALQTDFSGLPNIPRGGMTPTDFALTSIDYLLPQVTFFTYSNEMLSRVDSYFSRYGYQTNKVKVPNIYGRNNFNYVKTDGAIVRGNAPSQALIHMENQLNSGFTFWHIHDGDDSVVGNYNISNSIVKVN